jgi:hypoxanthine phosphoribosyltransferase
MTVTPEELAIVRQSADCLWNEAQVEQAIARVANDVTDRLAGSDPLVLVVMKGGFVFAGRLLMHLDFPLEVDYIHVSRYGTGLTGSELHWKVIPQQKLRDRHVLIVDDILDEGYTLKAIVEACFEHGAVSVQTAVLVDKQHPRKCDPTFNATFTALVAEDRYLFGYGMDYKNYWRNAPGIFAIKES